MVGGFAGCFRSKSSREWKRDLRTIRSQPDLVLADYFDYMAGTSTGAIIATCLSWGMSVAQVQELYITRAIEIFSPAPLYRRFWNKFGAEAITRMFKVIFSEDGEGKIPALLSTKKLRTLLTLVMRNHTTGSPWPVSNNPAAKFNDPARLNCNLHLPVWQLVRASTAAPVYFPPETIELGGIRHVFVDGGITPYNNPALLLFSMPRLRARARRRAASCGRASRAGCRRSRPGRRAPTQLGEVERVVAGAGADLEHPLARLPARAPRAAARG